MNYIDFKNSRKKDSEIKGLFFAFNDQQFKDGCEKVGASKENKVVSIGAGGFILKSEFENFKSLMEHRIKKLEELMKDKEFALGAFKNELVNTEYNITYDESGALGALGIDMEFIEKNDLLDTLKKAKEEVAAYHD